ncbi:nucleotidyltransferase domain-containing protein [Guptibacillus algicola]|uniref:nucleotidyltransferase domain-containing protein n=1 Tax=Guptibacillus algicola TaxID=225844 RepID=UPI001CD7BF26|nr:nucleotidyltransferase domain-containing protein [Alkalihalobacillus algicola]MCA0989513.1 nucleotidyltransferase domain-containing protein [Alkalihalobacillus algicola]
MLNVQITPIRFATYAKRLVDRLKTPALRGVIITGSFARGEAGPYADLDLWCFYHQEVAKPPYLPELPGVSIDLRSRTLEEYKRTLSGEREVVAPFFEQLVLYGDTPFILPAKESIRSGKQQLLKSIESRIENCPSKEEYYDMLNEVMYMIRIERYLAFSEYPLTISDMYATERNETHRKLIERYSSCLLGEEIINARNVDELLHDFIDKRR